MPRLGELASELQQQCRNRMRAKGMACGNIALLVPLGSSRISLDASKTLSFQLQFSLQNMLLRPLSLSQVRAVNS